jgi:hypothetical protein
VIAAVAWRRRAGFRGLATDLAMAAAPALLIALPVYAALIAFVGWKIIVEDCHLFYTHLPASLVFYNSHRTGLDQPLFSFTQMIGASAVGMAALSAIALLSARGGSPLRRVRWIWIALGCSFLVALAIRVIAGAEWDGSPMRALPFLLLAMIVFGRRKQDGALIIIAVYSLAILARVVLRVPSGGAFGAFFLPTSLILFSYLFLRLAPGYVERLTRDKLAPRRARLIGAGMLIALLLPTAVVYAVRYRRNFDFKLETSRGELFVRRPIGVAYREALDFIAERTTPADTIAILPEGSELAFLGERRMALRLQIFHPGFLDEQGERDEIARLHAAGARYALVVNRPMHEFGADVFGRDYFPTLGRWVDERYRLVKVCGASQDERLQIGDPIFFVKIFENRAIAR